jgi:Flp pilus assembly protein TadD
MKTPWQSEHTTATATNAVPATPVAIDAPEQADTDPVAAAASPSHTERAETLAAARANFEKARLALEMGKPRLTVTLLDACLRIEPDHPEYLGVWGYAQTLIGGNLKAARDACDRAIQGRSYDATLHAQRGCVLKASGRPQEARACFETALQQDPQQRLAQTQLASLGPHSGDSWFKSILRHWRR